MSRKRMISLLSLILMLALTAGMSLAQGPEPLAARSGAEGAGIQASVGEGFTYQGRLKDGSGNPVNDVCALDFTLWDAESGGTLIGHQIVLDVAVDDGYLAVLLNSGEEFGEDAFTGEARWLKIAVKCSGDAGWNILPGRQLLSAAPYALSLRPGAVISGTVYYGPVLDVVNSNSTAGEGVVGGALATSGPGYGVYGWSDSIQGAGVLGKARSFSGGAAGVWGESVSTEGVGVVGYATALSGETTGVWGQSLSPDGYGGHFLNLLGGEALYAEAGGGTGVYGTSSGGWGGYLRGGTGAKDLVLGGVDAAHDDGNLSSEPDYPSSDLNLFSNHLVAIHLDENDDEADGRLLVWNGANQVALEVSEAGNLTLRNDLYLGSDGGPNGNILATAAAGADLALHTNDNIYADLDDDNDGNSCFIIRDGTDANLWTQCGGKGMTTKGTSAVAVETDSGPREMYAVSSPGLWFEDFGSAALVDGQATVEIDPLFAEVSNPEAGYQVYLTPISTDLVLISVTAKTPTAFKVRGATLDGQPAVASFDYRIVAKRAGYEDYRMETAESMVNADAGP